MMEIKRHEIAKVRVWLSENNVFVSRWKEPDLLVEIKQWLLAEQGIKATYDKTRRLTFYGDYMLEFEQKEIWAIFGLPVDLAMIFKLRWGGR